MRILLSIHHELSADAGASGATLRLGEALTQLGHGVELVSFDDINGNPATKCYRFPWHLPRLIKERGRFDVVDLSSGDGWVFGMQKRMKHTLPQPLIVARSHGLEHAVVKVTREQARLGHLQLSWKYPIYHGGYRLWECGRSFRTADICFFLNQEDRQFATSQLGVDPARTVLARNGVAQIFIDRAIVLQERPALHKAANIAFVGTYLPRKGIGVMRDAMIVLLRQYRFAGLGYFGTGAGRETVLSDFPQDLHHRISVTPRYRNADLPTLLENYHVLAFPSLSEGAALTPVEAMACGLVPVVSAAPGAHEKITDGVDGLVIPVGDPAALVESIGRLLNQTEFWRTLRLAALSSCQRHAWRDIARDTVDVYAKARQNARFGLHALSPVSI